MKKKKKYDFFLSYASTDVAFAGKLRDALIEKGFTVWHDRGEIQPGQNFVIRLEEGLERSQTLVVVISPRAVKSSWVKREYTHALALPQGQIPTIIPIILRMRKINILPSLLAALEHVDFQDESAFDKNVDRLVSGLVPLPPEIIPIEEKKIVKPPLPPPVPPPELQLLRKLYTIQGLKDDLREESVFQDFDIRRPGPNINPVYFLWADVFRGCQINAYTNKHYLRVLFTNQRKSYPCSIAVRPKDEKPLKNSQGKRFLSFEARIPSEALRSRKLMREVGIAIRVVNGWVQHWEYAIHPRECSLQFKVSSSVWTKCSVDLKDRSKWSLFTSDGNYLFGPERADFEIISTVVFELGSPGQLISPKRGRGMIDIRNISLSDT